jgi:hypothetical protein
MTSKTIITRFRAAAALFNASGKGRYEGRHQEADGKIVRLVRIRDNGGLVVECEGEQFLCSPKSVKPV